MVKLETLQKEIDSIYENYKHYGRDSVEGNRARRRLSKIIPIRDYLANNPSEDYLQRDKVRITTRLDLLQDAFGDWHKQSGIKDIFSAQREYDKMNNVATLKRHLANINYILTN